MRVVVSLRARSDILGIHSYLAQRGSTAADQMLVRFSERFDELREFPLLGRRGLLIDFCIAFYIVACVIDGRRDLGSEMPK